MLNIESLFDSCLEGVMNIRKAMDMEGFDRIMEIYKNAQLFMMIWKSKPVGTLYPSPELIREDILARFPILLEEETKRNS